MCHLGIRLQPTFGVIIEVSSRFSRKTSCDKLSNARNLWRVVPLRSHLLPAGGLSGSKGRAQDVPSRISCGSLRFALPTFNSNWCGILLLQHASTNSEELQQKLPMSFMYRAAMILGLFRGRSGPVSLPSEHEEGLAIWVSTWSSYIISESNHTRCLFCRVKGSGVPRDLTLKA